MEELKKKRSLAKTQFTRTEKSLRRLLDDERSLEEQIGKRFNEMSQKWQEVQDAHDLYTQELPEEQQVEAEEKYIEEIEVRFEAIERETVITMRKFSQKLPPAMTAKTTGTVPKNEGSVVTGDQSSSSNNPPISSVNLEVPQSSVDQPSVETITQRIGAATVGGLAAQLSSDATESGIGTVGKESVKSGIQFEKQKLDKFEGDIRKYPGFKDRFNSYIVPRYPKSEIAFLLRTHLSPAIRDEVENVEDNMELLWHRLDAKYGNPRKYIDAVLSDLSKVSKGDGVAALNMINTVEKAYRDLVQIGSEIEMSNSYMISMIEKKLPDQMRMEWIKLIAEKGEKDSQVVFSMLMEFLARWRKIIEYDAAAIRKTSDKKIVGQTNHVAKNRQQKSEKSEACWIHEDGNHPVWKCKIFQMMTVKDKLELVKQKQACHACFETSCKGSKDPAECGKAFKCPMKGCGKPHNILIHQ
jgi:hypothetical protein